MHDKYICLIYVGITINIIFNFQVAFIDYILLVKPILRTEWKIIYFLNLIID